jgi:hypothetical protein
MAGNVQRRPDGKWRARYRDANHREHARHFPRKRDAEQWLASQDVAIARGEWVDPTQSKITVGEWLPRWLALQVQLKPTTMVRYEGILRRQILPRCEVVPLDRITRSAQVLPSTAASLGGCENLLAGRPGSWEANLVRSLISGRRVDGVTAPRYRTEPLVVTLNIAELIDETYLHPGLMTLDDALAAREERCDQTDDGQLDMCEQEQAAIAARYADEFARYA